MISEAACEGIECINTVQRARTPVALLRIEGVLQRMLMLSEMETARTAGTVAEKTKRSAVDALVIRDDTGTRAEYAQGVQTIGDRADRHIDLRAYETRRSELRLIVRV